MKLPEREYYTIPEVAARWKTTERHILELILNRHLDSVALVAGDGTRRWPDPDNREVWHEQKARQLLEVKTWHDLELLFDLYTLGKGSVRQYFDDPAVIVLEPSIEIEAGHLLITNSEIREFEARNGKTDEEGEKPIEPRERNSYLKLIKLLCDLNGLDISEPYKAYGVLEKMAAARKLSVPISENNAAPKLKAARDID